MNRKVLLIGGLVILPLLVLLALSFRFDPRAIDSPLVGKQAPDFALADLDGNIYRLEDLRGKPVLINFWATWCRPCLIEHPYLLAASRRYQGRVHFLGVVYQDEPDQIRRFLTSSGAWGPSLVDADGGVAIAYGVYGAPETFFVNRDGKIVEKVTSVATPEVLTRVLESLL